MGLFSKDKKNKIIAPLSGKAIKIAEVPDKVFADKVLGDGIAIIPDKNEVLSPVSGTIVQIAHTFHAIGIESDGGAEILVHLGIDTVELNGSGFTCYVNVGDHVDVGDKLMDMDLKFIESQGYKTVSPCIITNIDEVKNFDCITGNVIAGKTTVLNYKK